MGTALQIVDVNDFAVMRQGIASVQAVIEANLGADEISPNDLVKVKVPSGGGMVWEIRGIDGDEATKEIVGVVVLRKDIRAYWSTRGMGSPPDCSSSDCVTGFGNPGGECRTCRFAQYGSAINEQGEQGKGQACKQNKLLFMLRKDDMLPIIVYVPPSSLVSIRKYLVGLTSRNIPAHGVLTRLSLQVEKNGTAKYSRVIPTVAGRLSESEANQMLAYGTRMRAWMERLNTSEMVEDIS